MVYSISQVNLCDLVTLGKFSPTKVKMICRLKDTKWGEGPFRFLEALPFHLFFNYLKKSGIMTIILADLFHWAPIIQLSN